MKKATAQPLVNGWLKDVGLKVTGPRQAILKLLISANEPLSAKGIFDALPKPARANQATVYRNLENLQSTGLIRQVNFQHDHNHYELAINHHHHAICQSCGMVVDIASCDITSLETQVKNVSGFVTINSHALEFFGICRNCDKK